MSLSAHDQPHTSPPKPRLTFRVGVVGHRPNRLVQADLEVLSDVLHRVLAEVKTAVETFAARHQELFSDASPVLRAVSPLAEGTDRMFARQALALGYELCCPMPFAQAEYEKDFAPEKAGEENSLAAFGEILAQAEKAARLTTFELDGTRAREGPAYGAAGRVVLNQSDLLVVVWDGLPPAGGGGTVQTLHEAMAYRVPVLWIDAHAPHSRQLLRDASDLACLDTIQRCVPALGKDVNLNSVVEQTLSAPQLSQAGTRKPHLLKAFLGERKPLLNPAFLWKLFRDLAGSNRFSFQSWIVPDFENAIESKWPTDGAGIAAWVNRRLRPHYAWADKLADYYADYYRSSFVATYLLAAFAVALALIPWTMGWTTSAQHAPETICTAVELLVIAFIIGLVAWGRTRRWHERWMDYRLVAELTRQLRLLIPLGGGRPFPRLAPHLGRYGNPHESWMYWYVRAIERAAGLPRQRVTREFLCECLGELDEIIRGQMDFHRQNSERSERLDHRLHALGLWLFGLTAAAVAFHFTPHLVVWAGGSLHWSEGFIRTLTAISAVFPALGGALAAINNQAEFARLAKRSHAMADRLELLHQEISALRKSEQPTSTRTIEIAVRAAQLMVDEVSDWRVIFQDRPPVLPG